MSDPHTDRERFLLDLDFLVNGTLDDECRAWMEARLAENPAWQSDVEFARQTREVVRQARSTVPADIRWERLKARLVEDGVVRPAPSTGAAPRQKIPQTPRRGWGSLLALPLSLPWLALGLAFGVIAVQGYLLISRDGGPGAQAPAMRYRAASAPATSCSDIAWLRVAVSPALSVGDWDAALRNQGLSIAAGPHEGGEWTLRVNAGIDPEVTRKALLTVPGIEEARAAAAPAESGCL